MRTIRRFLTVVVLLLIAVTASPQVVQDVIDTWYTDGTFTSWVGYSESDCNANFTQVGSQTDWMIQDRYGCYSGTHTTHCFHWDGSTWVQIQCP